MKRQRPPMRRAAAIGDLVNEIFRQQGMEKKRDAYRAWQVWDAVVGPQIAVRARPMRLREGVLEVRVEQAAWMQQLQLLKPKILAKLNEALGGPVLTDIFWRRGKLEQPPLPPAPLPDWQSTPLTAAEEAEIRQASAPLEDPELRRAFERVLNRQRRLEKARKK